MSLARTDVLVLGAGVVGLTTAVRLSQAGLAVRVRAHELPERTTSAYAGAILTPLMADHPQMARWRWESWTSFERLAGEADTGVRMVSGLEVAREAVSPPGWVKELSDFHLCGRSELPEGFVSGWQYTAPIIDMRTHLGYLVARLTAAGGRLERGRVASLNQVATQAPIVVNCTGFGARELVPDPDLVPIRGDLVVVANPGIETFFAEETGESPDLIYILPQGERVVLGGTAVYGDSNVRPDPATAAAILRRCAAVEPSLQGARVLEHRVGVRPTRPRIRLERVRHGQCHLIHNYGHGGAGVSLSWGCAREVLSLIEQL